MSNTNIIKELPTHLITTAITFLSNYHDIIIKDPNVSVWYGTNVLNYIKHLQEVLNEHNISCIPTSNSSNTSTSEPSSDDIEGIVNNYLTDLYIEKLNLLANDLSNTDLMDQIKAFKLIHPEIVNAFHKPVVDASGSMSNSITPSFYEELEKRGVQVINVKVDNPEPNVEDLKGLPLTAEEQGLFEEYRGIFSYLQFDTTNPILIGKLIYLKVKQPNVYEAFTKIIDIPEWVAMNK